MEIKRSIKSNSNGIVKLLKPKLRKKASSVQFRNIASEGLLCNFLTPVLSLIKEIEKQTLTTFRLKLCYNYRSTVTGGMK